MPPEELVRDGSLAFASSRARREAPRCGSGERLACFSLTLGTRLPFLCPATTGILAGDVVKLLCCCCTRCHSGGWVSRGSMLGSVVRMGCGLVFLGKTRFQVSRISGLMSREVSAKCCVINKARGKPSSATRQESRSQAYQQVREAAGRASRRHRASLSGHYANRASCTVCGLLSARQA